MKTHLPEAEFTALTFRGVWLLVRDPRDALYSWYRYHRNFAQADWERVPDSFREWLSQPFFAGPAPVENWTAFYRGWWERAVECRSRVVTRFEDLKQAPLETIAKALHELDVEVPGGDLRRAVARSTFEAMRRHEEATVVSGGSDQPQARIMRKGKVGEWKEWMTPELRTYFSGAELRSAAGLFGYGLDDPGEAAVGASA